MRKLHLTVTFAASCLAIAACSDGGTGNAANEASVGAEGNVAVSADGGGSAGGAASSNWPRGARIVEENGVTFRVDPDGTRVRLGDSDARIVVENGVRYRVESSGTRVRIDDRGIDLDLDGPDIPGVDVDVGTNRKGNLDVDVNTNGSDATPKR